MGWTEDKSRARVQDHIDSIGAVELKPLAREVSDLESLLSETVCREITGAHTYVAVTNFDDLSSDSTMRSESYQRLIQATHVYQREVTHIVEKAFEGYRVHFQGSKVHVLFYLPVNDERQHAINATLAMLVIDDFVRNVFNTEYDSYPDWKVGAGADIGVAIGTRNGVNGKRELLFLGNPANRAAKITVDRSSKRITETLYKHLPEDLQAQCIELTNGHYRVSCDQETLDSLCETYGVTWSRAASAARIADARKQFPLAEIEYSDANTAIDFSLLSWKNNKRVTGASVFADVSGFTQFVEDAQDDAAKESALKLFHVIRKEMTKVACTDYGTVHVQFQGDRSQTLGHLPKGDSKAIAAAAVETAISMQSSFEQVIKPEFPEAEDLTLKIGIDLGTTLATQLGAHGDRDNVCLGTAVESAAAIEERCSGGMIGISKAVYNGLADNDLQAYFEFNKNYDCWIARGLTWEKIDSIEESASYREKALSIGLTLGGIAAAGLATYAISKATETSPEPPVEPSRTYAD